MERPSPELMNAVGKLIMQDDPPSMSGPMASPVDRFVYLPEYTRKFLEDLREEDILELRDAVKFHRNAKTVGRFGRWLVMSIVASFIGMVAFGEKIAVVFKWVTPGGTK